MSERYEYLVPIVGLFALPIAAGLYMLVSHLRERRLERQQSEEYLRTLPGFDTTKHD